MPNRLEPVNLVDFSGGLNLRENQFQLAENESPEMHNITIDPLGGIYSRRGWERWNDADIASDVGWDPRRAFLHSVSTGTDHVYIAANSLLYVADNDTEFTLLSGVPTTCVPHMADFAAWGDYAYIACGRGQSMRRRRISDAPVTLVPAGASKWNNDYTTPGASLVAPSSDLVEAHSGYLFVANISEDAVVFPNRLRWSHPTSPTDWAQQDFIDIDIGGNRITALMSYEDHLLIFKTDSVWALYGYDLDSWQLVQKSATCGALSPQAVTRSERAVFFASASDRGAVYVYDGERPVEISEQLRYVFERLIAPELIWVGWMDRKLWVTLPWSFTEGPTEDNAGVFVYDPSVGERGAWTYYHSTEGSLGPLVGGSNVDTQAHPMGVLRATDHPCVVRLNARDDANDLVSWNAVLGYSSDIAPVTQAANYNIGFLVTGNDITTGQPRDEEIVMSGMPGLASFHTRYKTPWVHAGWPTRKKSWRRPDFVCRDTGINHQLHVSSYRDYEETQIKRQYTLEVMAGSASALWGQFTWRESNDPTATKWGAGNKKGGMIRRGNSFGLCKSLQLLIEGNTPGAAWAVDAIILKIVMRRLR
jgi:hypothetical protein